MNSECAFIRPHQLFPRSNSPYLPRRAKIKSEPGELSGADSTSSKLSISQSEIQIHAGKIEPLDTIVGKTDPLVSSDKFDSPGKVKIESKQIESGDDIPLSCLEELFSSSSGSSSKHNDTLGDLEFASDEIEDTSIPVISFPDLTRNEAGPNWRIKEALLNSYYFGKPTISATEFARSQSELKTAEVLEDSAHSLDSKKYYVKVHLGMYLHYIIHFTIYLFRRSSEIYFFRKTYFVFSELSTLAKMRYQLYCINSW